MFWLCLIETSNAMAIANSVFCISASHHMNSGAADTANNADIEEYLKMKAVSSHVAHTKPPTGNDIAMRIPKAVATPLPP